MRKQASLESVIKRVFYAKPPPGPLELFLLQQQDALAWEMEFADKNLRHEAVMKRKTKRK